MATRGDNNSGDFADFGIPNVNINARTAVEVGKVGSNLIPIPGAGLIGGAFTFAGSEMDVDSEKQRFRQTTGVDLDTAARNGSVIAKRKRNELGGKSTRELTSYGAAAAGSAAGAYVGSALLPFGGTIIGGVAGGFMGDTLFGGVSTTEPDVVSLAARIDDMHAQGIPVPKEMTAALLMASLDGRRGKTAEDQLQAGPLNTRDFNIAVEQSLQTGNFDTIRAMMPEYENDMYAIVKPVNYDPDKGAAGHFAEMIDSGVIRASDFIADPNSICRACSEYDGGERLGTHYIEEDPRATALLSSRHVDVQSLARDMNRQGISMSDDGTLQPLPGHRRGGHLEV